MKKQLPTVAGALCALALLAGVVAAHNGGKGNDAGSDRGQRQEHRQNPGHDQAHHQGPGDGHEHRQDHGRGIVLSLGDSIAFGYINRANPQYVNADNFVGYPEFLSARLGFEVLNASCPGTTTGHLLSTSLPDFNGNCIAHRANYPLHVSHDASQLDFATSLLTRERNVRLVTIGAGANDAFALQARCAANPAPYGDFDTCVGAELQAAVLPQVAQNLSALVVTLRGTGYDGPIVLVNYYSPDYTDQRLTLLTGALNQAIAAVAQSQGVQVADVFNAFLSAAASAGGQTCATGLLNVNPANLALCDIHPSLSGQRLIAQTIAAALPGNSGHKH